MAVYMYSLIKLLKHFVISQLTCIYPTIVTWQIDDPGVFGDISQLKNRPAHIAVFLHYLLSNCDPSSLVSSSYQLLVFRLLSWCV